jgi:poly-gamma-glutamate synthesis protein (capsule biosynthesis protein)
MLADNPGKEIAKGVDPFAEFKPLFQQADFVIGNLECVVATKGEPFDKPWTFRAHPHCVPLLKKHFHALSIANNHTGDFGREAFVEMLDLFKGEVPLFGGGRIKQAARQPLILEKHGLKLALLGYNGFKPRAFEATETEAGCAWLVEEEMLADIAAVKSNHKPDLILPYLHWGREGDREPQPYQQAMAKHLCEAGASAVIGAHPHVRQTIEIFNDKPVMYSLGNFVFDGFEGAPEAQTGWLWRLTLDRHGVVEWDTIVVRLEEKSGLPHLDLKTPAPSGKRGSSMIVEKTVSLK